MIDMIKEYHFEGEEPIKFDDPKTVKELVEYTFDEFDHTVVFEGIHSFREVMDVLEKVGYIEKSILRITVQVLAYPKANYVKYIESCDPILDEPIIDLEKSLPMDGIVTLVLN